MNFNNIIIFFIITAQLVVHQNDQNTGGNSNANAGAAQVTTSIAGALNSSGGGGGGGTSSAGNPSSSSTASTTTGSTAATTAAAQQQTLVINHQGQLISLPVLQAATAGNSGNANTNTSANAQQAVNLSGINFAALTNSNSISNAATQLQSNTISTVAQQQQHTHSRQSNAVNASSNQTNANNGTTPIKTLLEEDEKSDTNSIDDQGPTIANMPTSSLTSHSQGTHIPHGTTVDGVNLDEIREFAKAFKLRRLALGLTQTQVGQALSATKGPAYSQSAICRFEKLDITPKSAAKIKPVLEKWMQEAELKYADRLKTGSHQNFADLLGTENTKKRKRRTSFTPQALEILNEYFEKNTHPSGNQGADMTMLAQKLNYDREVIRVWFCNKRQALKNTLKKLKQSNDGGLDVSSDQSESESPISSQHQTPNHPPQQQSSQAQIIVTPTIQLATTNAVGANSHSVPQQSAATVVPISIAGTLLNAAQLEHAENGNNTVVIATTASNVNTVSSGVSNSANTTKTVITLTNPEQKGENSNNNNTATSSNNNGNGTTNSTSSANSTSPEDTNAQASANASNSTTAAISS